ncbi:hypothetical protein F4778DRAFT_312699 [Xylariomycetidae sp. FL2044]|nr:hypothetical protein F4778DRAFT_312699 [Xylariomycetidae sp. FL2044]
MPDTPSPPKLTHAQTFPRVFAHHHHHQHHRVPTSPQSLQAVEPWMTTTAAAAVRPYVNGAQKRVSYPRLAAADASRGDRRAMPRELSEETRAQVQYLRSRESYQQALRDLRREWKIVHEIWYRRVEVGVEEEKKKEEEKEHEKEKEGDKEEVVVVWVPTLMLIAWDEESTDFADADKPTWAQTCEDLVSCLRENDCAFFAVEIVHWTKTQFGVVDSSSSSSSSGVAGSGSGSSQ